MNIIWLDTVDSTNSEALRRLGEFESGTVLVAREQTAGRGQRGNRWFTQPGANLTFSIILHFGALSPLAAADAHWLNYLTADAVAAFLSGFGVACSVKWPNDVYVGRRKICGILIENSLKGAWVGSSVIGVGININQEEFPQLAGATSLYRCCGRKQNLDDCLEAVTAIFERRLPMLFDPSLRPSLFDSYSQKLFQKGVSARYHDLLRDREYTGILQGVDPEGRLCILDRESGETYRYRFKEVSYIL